MKFFKFEEKNKGLTLHLVAIILFTVLCVLVAVNFRGVLNVITAVIDVLVPIFVGAVIALVLFPFQNKIEQALKRINQNKKTKQIRTDLNEKNKKGNKKRRSQLKVARAVSIIISFIVVLAVLVLFVLVIIPQVGESYNDLQSQAQKYLDLAREFLNTSSDGTLSAVVSETLNVALNGFYELFADLTPYIVSVVKSFVEGTADILLGAVISIYLLLDRERIINMFLRTAKILLPEKAIDTILKEKSFMINVFDQYVVGKMIGILVTWILSFVALILINVPYAPLISIILSIMNVVPYIGIFIGAIPGLFIVFITEPGMVPLFVMVVILVHLIDNKLIEQYVLKAHTKLDSELVIISIVLFSGLFGFWTMFIAAPLATIFCHFAKIFIDKRLNLKSLPSDTADWTDKTPENTKA